MKKTAEERFWEKVKIGAESDCWEWTGHIYHPSPANPNKLPYGKFFANSKLFLAHRYSYELHNGPIPPGMSILHKCDNPKCVNPAHLFLGTHADNMQDVYQKGRKSLKGFGAGEGNSHSTLTDDDIRKIRSLFPIHSTREIAEIFGVTQEHISRIVARAVWKHVA